MDKTDKFFVAILKNHLSSIPNEIPNENLVDWNKMKKLARIHRVVGICYSYLKNRGADPAYLQYFEMGFYSELNRYQKRAVVLEKIKKMLNDNAVDHICIKGSYIADLYPVPELRTMSDLDILVEKKNVETVHSVFMENGSEYIPEESDEDVRVYKYLGISLEIHSDLVSKNNEINEVDFKTYFSDVFSHKVGVDKHTYILEEEYNMIYTIFHIAKHFYNSGCGIRMLMDLPVLIKRYHNLCWDNIWTELERIRLKEFTVKLFMICEKWFGKFGVVYPDKYRFSDMEMIEDFILAGGVYGFHGRNTDAYQIKKKGRGKEGKYNYLAGMLRWAFPSYTDMRQFSRWFREKPAILLPLAYVERFIRNAKERGGIIKWGKNVLSGKKDIGEKEMILGIMNLK